MRFGWALLVVWAMAVPSMADAQYSERSAIVARDFASPERMVWELFGVGPYEADDAAESTAFEGDKGPLLRSELDVNLFRVPYVGTLALGARFGWVRYKGAAMLADGADAQEKTKLILYPLTPLAVLRVDVLAREFDIPFTLAGKIGLDVVRWKASKNGVTSKPMGGKGISLGLAWGVQLALELDFLEPRAARRLDEDWGINHSFLFFELFGSTAGLATDNGGALDVGDKLTWTLGLGFVI